MTLHPVCPNDLQPCRGNCHNSHDCARWGTYSCKPHHAKNDEEILLDRIAQSVIEGRIHHVADDDYHYA